MVFFGFTMFYITKWELECIKWSKSIFRTPDLQTHSQIATHAVWKPLDQQGSQSTLIFIRRGQKLYCLYYFSNFSSKDELIQYWYLSYRWMGWRNLCTSGEWRSKLQQIKFMDLSEKQPLLRLKKQVTYWIPWDI